MKYVIVSMVVLFGFWLWSSNRRVDKADREKGGSQPKPSDARTKSRTSDSVQPMLKCSVCGVHLPQTEALIGQRGTYCGLAHRKQVEG